MKNLKKYNEFINESVRDFLKPKSNEEILRDLGNLTPDELLKKSAVNGFVEGVKIALEKGADPSADNNYAIRVTSINGHTEIVKLLLDDLRVDPSVDDNWSIKIASEYGHLEIVELLLQDKRVDPSAGNNFAIKNASYKRQTEVVKLLLQDKRVDPSAGNNFVIKIASYHENIEIVKLLLNDSRVIEKLTENEIKNYEKQIKDL